MMEDHLSERHLATAEVDLLLPAQATLNDGRSTFKTTPDDSCKPPHVVVLTLPTQATFNDGQSSFKKKHLTTAANPLKLT